MFFLTVLLTQLSFAFNHPSESLSEKCDKHVQFIEQLRDQKIGFVEVSKKASLAEIVFLGESHLQTNLQRHGYWDFLNHLQKASADFNCLFVEQEPDDFFRKIESCPKEISGKEWCDGFGPEFTPAVAFALKTGWRVIPIDERQHCKMEETLSIENFACRNQSMAKMINQETGCKKSVVINGTGHLFKFLGQSPLTEFIDKKNIFKINISSSNNTNEESAADLTYHWRRETGELVCSQNPPLLREEWAALLTPQLSNPLIFFEDAFVGDWNDFNAVLFLK